jgi:hypothetical protein
MAKKKLRIDYTLYSPSHRPGDVCWDFRTLSKAKSAARGLGIDSRIYQNFNLESKRGKIPHDYWSSTFYWMWNGKLFVRKIDRSVESSGWGSRSGSVTPPPCA